MATQIDAPTLSGASGLDGLRDWLNEAASQPNNIWFRWREYYMKLFEPAPEWRLLDFGAYVGANLLHYAELGHHIEGVEAADNYVRAYRDRVAGMSDAPVMHHCLIEEYEPVESVDAVLCCEVLEYSPNPMVVFDRAAACLRDGGVLFVSVPARESPRHYRVVTPGNLMSWYERAGFVVDAVVMVPPVSSMAGQVSQIVAGGRLNGHRCM